MAVTECFCISPTAYGTLDGAAKLNNAVSVAGLSQFAMPESPGKSFAAQTRGRMTCCGCAVSTLAGVGVPSDS